MKTSKRNAALILALMTGLNAWQTPALAGTDVGDSAIQPRFFESDRAVIKPSVNGGPIEITTKDPRQTIGMANMVKASVMRTKHKSNFKTDGHTFTVVDETAKKTWIIKTDTSKIKKVNADAPLVMAELFPKNSIILYRLTSYYEGKQKWAQAHESYLKACQIDNADKPSDKNGADKSSMTAGPQNLNAVDAATDAYYQLMMGHYATAIKELSKAIEKHPKYILNYRNRALAYRKINKIDLAVADEKKIAELSQAKKLDYHEQSKEEMETFRPSMYLMQGSYEMALTASEAGAKKHPSFESFIMTKAQAEQKLGRYSEALRDFNSTLKLEKNLATKKAIQELADSAASMAKQGPVPYGDLAILKGVKSRGYINRKNDKQIILTVEQIAADHKGDFRVYEALARAYKEKSKWPARHEQLAILAKIEPKDSQITFAQIEAAQAVGSWPEAEKLCDQFFALLTNNESPHTDVNTITYVYMIRGLARQAQKNYAGAVADQTVVLKLEPDDSQALEDRAICYEKMNKPDLAKQDRSRLAKPTAAD